MRQVAWRLLPFLMICYFVSFLDRVNVGFAALQMVKGLHMSPAVFGFGGGIFFVSYFLFEVPSNLLLEKLGARMWIARIMITWGFLAAATAFVVGPKSFYAMRLLLGAAEAGFFPGVILYLTYWFPREYRARIVGMFTVAIPVSSFLGSPISAALLGVDGWMGLHGWQWMFIMEGAPAVLLGLFCLFVLSDKPASAHWLGPDQKAWLDGRLQSENLLKKRVGHISVWRRLEQVRFGSEHHARGKHRRQQRPANLAAANHQILRPDEHADGPAQFHSVRAGFDPDGCVGTAFR